ncbi:hypothetical protein K2X05_11260, partial [bacterium]|nr:hypothetical protein [bacterium]
LKIFYLSHSLKSPFCAIGLGAEDGLQMGGAIQEAYSVCLSQKNDWRIRETPLSFVKKIHEGP